MGLNNAGLLTRIARAVTSRERMGRRDEMDVEEAVLVHLRQMLNTRAGGAPTIPDYGMPEFSEMVHQFPDAIAMMQRQIRHSIATYEPRLRDIVVRHVKSEDDVLRLRFEIAAKLVADGVRSSLRFQTTVDSLGRVDIK